MIRVLVVSADPEERRRAVNAVQLVNEAASVVVASAAEFRDRMFIASDEYDVVIVDGDLHPRGGYAALYDIRARNDLEGRAPTPSIILASRETDRWLARWAGANDMLLKPVDAFALSARITALVGADAVPYGDAGAAVAQVAAATQDHRG